jgi:hypothetical protein
VRRDEPIEEREEGVEKHEKMGESTMDLNILVLSKAVALDFVREDDIATADARLKGFATQRRMAGEIVSVGVPLHPSQKKE